MKKPLRKFRSGFFMLSHYLCIRRASLNNIIFVKQGSKEQLTVTATVKRCLRKSPWGLFFHLDTFRLNIIIFR